MKKGCFVGFDTSNYTTSIAVADEEGKIVANLKTPLAVKEGERGLRQSDAVFAHVKNLPGLCDKLSDVLKEYSPLAVGCSERPRSVEGSYMPCFLSGIAAAHAFAAENSLQVFGFSHQDGHIRAAYYSSGARIDGRFAAFHVSGGTTEVLLVDPAPFGYNVELIGGSLDLNAGQCIDRAGVMMGLAFPAGAEMDRLALEYPEKIKGISVSIDGCYCNLSGVENKAIKLFSETSDKRYVSAYVFEFIARSLIKMTSALRESYPGIPVIYAGGVMSSKYISSRLRNDNVYFAQPAFSADNAAGIALLCRERYLSEK